MVQKKYLIIYFCIIFIFSCISKEFIKERYIEQKPKEEELIQKVEVRSNSFIFLSASQTEGDLFLYDFLKNSLTQLSFFNNKEIKIISYSPDKKFILLSVENYKPNIFIPSENKITAIKNKIYNDELLFIKSVEWLDNNSFLAIGKNYEYENAIFKVYLKSDDEIFYTFLDSLLIDNCLQFSLSHNKKFLAIFREDFGIWILNLENFEFKNIINLDEQYNISLIWNEDDSSIFYNSKNIIFNIDLNGFNKIVLVETDNIDKIYQSPEKKFKLYYTIKKDNKTLIFLKDIDKVGRGEFLFSVDFLKDLFFISDKILFYDTYKNEIYSIDLESLESKLIFNYSGIYSLTNNE